MNRSQVKSAAREAKHSGERPSGLLHGVEAQDALVALFDDFCDFGRAKNRRLGGSARRVAAGSTNANRAPHLD
jgi:hypothetical protein